MASARAILITLAAVATLSVGCKKQDTTTPADATPVADEAEETDEADDAEDADEAEGAVALNKANFDETINDHFSEVSDCYVAALEGNAELAGKLDADFTIGADGKVTNVVAAEGSTLSDAGLVACIQAAAAAWAFGVPADGEMTLRYSFNLAPG